MASGAEAQMFNRNDIEEMANTAIRFNQSDYEGTARSQAMGSAFGALGADLTSQSINPAGLGTYRATEIAIGFGVNINKNLSNYYGYKDEDTKGTVPFNVIGLTLNIDRSEGKTSGAMAHTFSISYSRLADYNRTASYEDKNAYNSLLDYFCFDYDGARQDKYDFEAGLAKDAGWLWGPYKDENDTITFATNSWEMPYGKDMLDMAAREDFDELGSYGLIDHRQNVKERGYKGETSFGYGLNISNMVYFGASMGIQSLSFRQKVHHREDYYGVPYNNAYDSFTYTSELKQDGSGVNFNAGIIVKPVNALRVGFAVHSPTFLSINERFKSDIDGAETNDIYYSRESNYEYRYHTPFKFVFSMAGVTPWGLISFDYERENGNKSKYKATIDGDDDDYYDDLTDYLKDYMKVVHRLRVGVEARVTNNLYVRGGYNAQTNPQEHGVQVTKYLHDAISGGLGFRKSNFFMDLAYICRRTNVDRWVLPDHDLYVYDPMGNQPAASKSKSHNGTLTLGFRF